jgi:1-hydroxycarotenoid 3,4-desaturase
VFNGDPAALAEGLLGTAPRAAVARCGTEPRSHSAWVWTFAARASGVPLSLHNVFFGDAPSAEFGPIAEGRIPDDPTLYVCAQDRAEGSPRDGPERFQIIMNAPAAIRPGPRPTREEYARCHRLTFDRLARFGLTFDPLPPIEALTGPAQFARMFPASKGAIYGLSPHGSTATFRRPTVRTALPGLWLAGGGVHPGPGVPMVAISGINAAESILADRVSTSPWRRTVTPGGTSMASRTRGHAPSR